MPSSKSYRFGRYRLQSPAGLLYCGADIKPLPPKAAQVLLVLLENFTGWERSEAWGDTDFFFSHRDDFEKIAVVGNPRWEAQVLAFTGAGLRKGPVKFFPETAESEARAWLAA